MFTFCVHANEGNGESNGLDSEKAKDFSGYSLIEAVPNTDENVELLRHLDANIDEDALDFWSDPTTIDKPVEILVHPELNKRTEQLFRERNITLRVVSKNFRWAARQGALREKKKLFKHQPLSLFTLTP